MFAKTIVTSIVGLFIGAQAHGQYQKPLELERMVLNGQKLEKQNVTREMFMSFLGADSDRDQFLAFYGGDQTINENCFQSSPTKSDEEATLENLEKAFHEINQQMIEDEIKLDDPYLNNLIRLAQEIGGGSALNQCSEQHQYMVGQLMERFPQCLFTDVAAEDSNPFTIDHYFGGVTCNGQQAFFDTWRGDFGGNLEDYLPPGHSDAEMELNEGSVELLKHYLSRCSQ